MTTTPSRAAEGLTRNEYVGRKLRSDSAVMGAILALFWLMQFELRLLIGLAGTYLLILVLGRLDYGRKWDRAHTPGPTPPAPGQHRSA